MLNVIPLSCFSVNIVIVFYIVSSVRLSSEISCDETYDFETYKTRK